MRLFRKKVQNRAELLPSLKVSRVPARIISNDQASSFSTVGITFEEASEHLDWLEANGMASKKIIILENGKVALV